MKNLRSVVKVAGVRDEVWSISATLKQDRPGWGKFLIGTGEGDKRKPST